MTQLTRRQSIAMAAVGSAILANPTTAFAQSKAVSALNQIRALDYTILYTRDMIAMRKFYEEIMQFEFRQTAGDGWVEFKVGSNILVLTSEPAGGLFPETIPAPGVGSVQLAFRVAPKMVDACAEELQAAEVEIIGEPTNQPWGHRTLFFRDPDNNILEIYADI
tara:strand:- start:3917 stop:4408 length:492 start_codon:yes stop_codon:yes gene_type:complete